MKQSIYILICFLLIISVVLFTGRIKAQTQSQSSAVEGAEEVNVKIELEPKEILKEKVLSVPTEKEEGFIEYRDQMTKTLRETLKKREIKEEFHFNPIKSLNGNIKFGGLHNGNVDIFFAPEMFIKPFDGLSIYALRHSHVYIPLKELKENISTLIIETLSLAAIENAVNFFTIGDKVLNGLLNFALKNGFTLLSKAFKDDKLPTWEYYYMSVGVRF